MNEVFLEGKIVGDMKRVNENGPVEGRIEVETKNSQGKKLYSYYSISGWGKVAEIMLKIKKGDFAFVKGELKSKKVKIAVKNSNDEEIKDVDGSPIMVTKEYVEVKVQKIKKTVL